MHCRNCDYSLWNLKARQCPECGRPFAPSEFEFVANSVRFCCPHCDQEYYGTGPTGHLVPRQFACVNCHQLIDMDEMVLRPAEGVRETETVIDPLPWLRRQTAGWLRCWWQTTWRGMIAPARMAQGIPSNASSGSAWWYLIATLFLCGLVGATVPLAVMIGVSAATGNSSSVSTMALAAVAPILNVIVNVIIVAIWGLIAHASLRLSGGCEYGLGHTMQALCYTAGPNIVTAIPCVGFYCMVYVSNVWWIVCAIIMLASLQRVHGGRASLAGLLFPVSSLILLVVAYFGLIFWAMNLGMTAAAQQNMYTPRGEAQLMTSAIQTWAMQHNGELPAHALALVQDGNVTAADFVAVDSFTFSEDVPVGEATLDDFMFTDEYSQQEMIDDLLAAQPQGIVAHRVGDFVFTYHGFDPAIASNLWVVLLIHDPELNAADETSTQVYVGTSGGTVLQYPAAWLPEQIRAQNNIRAQFDLPPLPEDLADVTQDQPVVDDSAGGG